MSLFGAVEQATRDSTGQWIVARGTIALDASNPTPVAATLTHMDTIVSVGLTLAGATTPGVGTSVLTYAVSGGALSIYAWKPTSNSNPTLVASTGTETVAWVVIGTRRRK